MLTKEIEQLLKKYFDGDTKLEEEKMLKDYFNGPEVAEQFARLKPMFAASKDSLQHQLIAPSFDERIKTRLNNLDRNDKKDKRRRLILSLSGIAAAIIFSLFTVLNQTHKNETYSMGEAEQAYGQITNALRFMVTQLDKGLDPMKESGSEINKAIQPTKKLGKLDQTLQKMITTPLDNEQ